MAIVCKECGEPNVDGAKVCVVCGAKLPAATPTQTRVKEPVPRMSAAEARGHAARAREGERMADLERSMERGIVLLSRLYKELVALGVLWMLGGVVLGAIAGQAVWVIVGLMGLGMFYVSGAMMRGVAGMWATQAKGVRLLERISRQLEERSPN